MGEESKSKANIPKIGRFVEERKTNTAKFGRFRKRQGKEVKYT